MDLPAAKDSVLICFPQHDISRKMLVCYVVSFLFVFGAAAILTF